MNGSSCGRDSVSRINVSVSTVGLSRNPNGNYEIWFVGDDFKMGLYFNDVAIGVYNAKTGKNKEVRLS